MLVRAVIDAIKYAMNGAKLPNWMKLAVIILLVALIWRLQREAVGDLSMVQRQTTIQQIRATRAMVSALNNKIDDVADRLDDVAAADSIRSVRIDRKVQKINIKVAEIDRDGTEGSNERFDKIESLIKKRHF